jgi:hypothetical protein
LTETHFVSNLLAIDFLGGASGSGGAIGVVAWLGRLCPENDQDDDATARDQ